MDRISEQQRAAIVRSSDARLRAKLVQAGYQPGELEVLDRQKLIELMVELKAEERERMTGAEAGAVAEDGDLEEREEVQVVEKTIGQVQISLEERKLILEERRIELERMRLEQEMVIKDRELQQERIIKERELEHEKVMKEKELEQKKLKLEWDMEKAKRDADWKESPANQLKLWGDALRNTIHRMPVESIDIVSWFQSLEQLFNQLKVPYGLQAVLMRPYMNDKAKSLLSRVDMDKSADYRAIKKYLLQEMQLSPSVYLDKFHSVCRESTETFHQFATRLSSLFDYYVESRKIGNNYDMLMELIVYDRMKATLPPYLSRHVLALESSSTLLEKGGWLGKNALVEALDAYDAGLATSGSKKMVGASHSSGFKPIYESPRPIPRTFQGSQHRGEPSQAGRKPEMFNRGSGGGFTTPRSAPVRRCFVCNSPGHVAINCPRRTTTATGTKHNTTGNSVPRASTNACTVSPQGEVGVDSVQPNPDVMCESLCYDSVHNDLCDAKLNTTSVKASTSGNSCQVPEDDLNNITDDSVGHLSFCDVEVKGLSGCVQALDDSGTQMSLVNPRVIETLNLPRFGKVVVRGAVGDSICAPLVNLQLRLPGVTTYTNVTCVVCEGLNLDLILVADIVTKLTLVKNNLCYINADDDVHCENETENVDVTATSAVTNVTVNNTIDNVNSHSNVCDDDDEDDDDAAQVLNVDDANDVNDDGYSNGATKRTASNQQLVKEQQEDKSLVNCWSLAQRGKAGYFIREDILYRREKILGQEFEQLCLPRSRREEAIKLAHQVGGGHLAAKKTKERLKLSFTWPTIAADVKHACQVCDECQKRRRVTVYDRIPIAPVPNNEKVFDSWVMDCMGPLFPNQKVKYNYCLVLCDRVSRFPVAFCLPSLSAKCVCNALLQLFHMTGIPAVIQSDCGSNFTSQLTRTFLQVLGCTPRFNVPGRPQQSGLVERLIGTLKNMISKVAADHPKSWTTHLSYVLWALREVPNETTGVPPWMLVYGRLPRGPLAILKENWCGLRDAPLNLGQTTAEYLADLRTNLEVANSYATEHGKREKQRYIARYNLRSREKKFDVGDQVLILVPDTTASKVFSRWQGPATVVEVRPHNSYLVELKGVRKHLHADKLRRYHISVGEVIVSPTDCSDAADEMYVNQCAVVYENDSDFGDISVLNSAAPEAELLPSQKIDSDKLTHLSPQQKKELLDVLDKFPECFSDKPGCCDWIQHEIHVREGFKPKRLRAYRVPESLKPEVEKQIQEMLQLGIIRISKSEMASPIVCVLKGKDGKDGVRLAVDYRYLNKYCSGDAYPMPDIPDLLQRVGQAKYISSFDVKGAYWQIPVHPKHQWLTAFVWDGGLYEFTRAPFGQKGSGNTFMRTMQQVMQPVKQFTASFVDDVSVYSNQWKLHLEHVTKFLQAIKKSGLTLNLKKTNFAQGEIKFVGHLIGSGQRKVDPGKVAAVHNMKIPETKKQVRQVLGFFSYFRDYIPRFSDLAKPLTDLTGKRIPNRIPWTQRENQAFEELKARLCQAANESLQIIDFQKPFTIHVDASDYAVAGLLTQPADDGTDRPVEFISGKLNPTQTKWSTIEKETFATIWALKKFRKWIFGKPVVLYTDHNPITYLTDAAPKSAKLMRWALAIQEYDVTFHYKMGSKNVADCLSRLGPDDC